MTARHSEAIRQSDTAFLGHPRGLGWLSFAEAWERFSYYGMLTLLVPYMVHQLLQPGHVEAVLGFGPFRAAIEYSYGPLSPQALALAIGGLYSGLVYLTPIGGGWLADRFLGRTMAVTIGALLMTVGHFLMAFDASFLLALLCLLIGVGCFKGNIAAQVGALYAPGDNRRADAFQIYMLGIQIAVVVAPIVCSTLGEKVDWHYGFGAAGIGMLLGLVIYLRGRTWLPPEPVRGAREAKSKLRASDWRVVLVLAALVPVLAISSIGNQEIFGAYQLWGEANLQLEYFGFTMPIGYLITLDAGVSFVTMIGSVAFWRWWSRRRTEPDEITKLTIGVFIACIAPLALAAGSALQVVTGGKAFIGWALLFHIVNDIGFANVFPVGLALFSRAAPKGTASIMLGIYYLNLFACNVFVGWLGGFLEKMPAASFWLMNGGLIAAAGCVLLLVRSAAGRALAPPGEPVGAVATVGE